MTRRIVLALSMLALLLAACASTQTVAIPAACPPAPVIPAHLLTAPRNLCLLEQDEIPERFRLEWQTRCSKTQPETRSRSPS